MRGVGRALVEHLRRAVGQRTVRDVAVAGDPADVGRAPEHVRLGMQVVHDLVAEGRLREVAARRVHDALGLAGRPRRVEDEQRGLGGERARLVLGGCLRHDVVPPDVAALGPLHVVASAAHDQHVLDGLLRARPVAVGEGHVDGRLERGDLALAVAAVGRDDQLRAGVVDARSQAVGGEPAEDHRVDRAQPRDREHRGDRLRDHRHVDRHPVALADAESFKHVREALDLVGQLRIRHMTRVTRLAFPEQSDALAVARLDVTVEAVVGDVELAVGEPRRERRVRPVQHLGERGVPVQFAGLVGPERLAVCGGPLVDLRGRHGALGELRGRREPPALGEKVVDLAAHARSFAGRSRGGAVQEDAPQRQGQSTQRPPPSLPPIVGSVESSDGGSSGPERYIGHGLMSLFGRSRPIAYALLRPNIRFWHCDTRLTPELRCRTWRHPIPPMGCRPLLS